MDTIQQHKRREAFTLSFFSSLVALAGAGCSIGTTFVGYIFVGEMALPLLALVSMFSRKKEKSINEALFFRFIVAAVLSLTGFVISDLVRGSSPEQYLRGWGRNVLIASDFISLALITRTNRRDLWWFVLGFGIGGMFYLRLTFHAPLAFWKHDELNGRGYGLYATMVVAALSRFLPPSAAAGCFGVLAFKSFFWDYRSLAGLCTTIAAVLWFRRKEGRRLVFSRQNIVKYALLAALVFSAMYAGLKINDDEGRRATSDSGRVFMWLWSFRAILASPLIGYGSWSQSKAVIDSQTQVAEELFGERSTDIDVGSAGGVHSELLGSWVEGGLLGAAFFIFLSWVLLRYLKRALLLRPLDFLTPVVLFAWLNELGDLAAAPIGSESRPLVGLAAATVVLVANDWQERRQTASRPGSPTLGSYSGQKTKS